MLAGLRSCAVASDASSGRRVAAEHSPALVPNAHPHARPPARRRPSAPRWRRRRAARGGACPTPCAPPSRPWSSSFTVRWGRRSRVLFSGRGGGGRGPPLAPEGAPGRAPPPLVLCAPVRCNLCADSGRRLATRPAIDPPGARAPRVSRLTRVCYPPSLPPSLPGTFKTPPPRQT